MPSLLASRSVRFDLPDDYCNHYAELVGRLDVDDVNTAARRVLAPARLTGIVGGDRSTIEQPIRGLGYGGITVIHANGDPPK